MKQSSFMAFFCGPIIKDLILRSMITLIRHAQSLHNEKTQKFVRSSNIKYDWQHLSKDHYFLHQIKYCPELLDATITQKGRQEVPLKQTQCAIARQKVVNLQPDLILVSPLNRTLATCLQIFRETTCPVIALPILAEGLRNACDFSVPVEEKKSKYGHVNFQQVEKQGLYWYLNNDSEQNRAKYLQIIEKNKEKSYIQTLNIIFQYMEQTKIYETPTNLRQRTQKIKNLLREYSKTYKNIVVVSHFNIIRFLLAKQFNENDDPTPLKIKNCEILQVQIQKL